MVKGDIQVLGKAVELMDLLASGRPLSAAELSARLGQPRSTVYRILGTLAERGWIEEAQHGRYRIGAQLLATGRSALDQSRLREIALPAMKHLWRSTGLTVYLFVPSGDKAICLERIDGSEYDPTWLRTGGWLRYEEGASPRVLLAHDAGGARSAWESRLDENTMPGESAERLRAFRRRLQTIKSQGFEFYNGANRGLGYYGSVAAPLFDRLGHCIASITVGGRKDAVARVQEQADFTSTVASVAEKLQLR